MVPILVITAEEIRQSGKQTVTELLRELPINATGGLTELSGSNSFSSGAATISLRRAGSTATLALLNGRRIAPFGPPDPNFGQSGVVNLNAIPLDVIERIEILKDGASAIYGSEAIAPFFNSPTWRGNFRTTWQKDNWTTTSTVNYVDTFKSYFNPEALTAAAATLARNCGAGPDSASYPTYLGRCAIREYVTIDLGTEYCGFKNWRLNFNVRNIANERPSFDPRIRPINLNWYQPQGMNFVAGVRYSWN